VANALRLQAIKQLEVQSTDFVITFDSSDDRLFTDFIEQIPILGWFCARYATTT
jgi:hypothetical protein